jgi:tetraacyldisaccharide 4'-kinase
MTTPRGRRRWIRWLWTGRDPVARLARAALLPVAGLFRVMTVLRSAAYRRKLLPVADLPLPTVAVGNLTVGGSGKTPLAAWIAQYYLGRKRRPAILLRDYGGDERWVHERLAPGALVIPNADRAAGAAQAERDGADVLVLDDAYQRLDVTRDLNLAVVSAESSRAVRWPLPAGPWREGWGALSRADLIVVTRKRATAEAAQEFADELERRAPHAPVAVAHLGLTRLEGMVSGQARDPAGLSGRKVLAAAGIADPESFAVQVRATGARVSLVPFTDHHAYDEQDLDWLVRAAGQADYVVITEKDAVKLRHRWPVTVAEPLVAVLDLVWESNGDAVRTALDAVITPAAEF